MPDHNWSVMWRSPSMAGIAFDDTPKTAGEAFAAAAAYGIRGTGTVRYNGHNLLTFANGGLTVHPTFADLVTQLQDPPRRPSGPVLIGGRR